MTTSTERVKYINPEGACQAQGLYAHTARIPGVPLHFIAGQLAVGDDGGVVGKMTLRPSFVKSLTIWVMCCEGWGWTLTILSASTLSWCTHSTLKAS